MRPVTSADNRRPMVDKLRVDNPLSVFDENASRIPHRDPRAAPVIIKLGDFREKVRISL